MSAKAIIRRNKTSLLEILSGDHMLILNKVQEHSLISDREYKNLKTINNVNVEGHLGELLDTLMNKGEEKCQIFINLLKTDAMIQETFPNLKSIQWTVGNNELLMKAPLKRTPSASNVPGPSAKKPTKGAPQTVSKKNKKKPPSKTNNVPKNSQTIKKVTPKAKAKKTQTVPSKNKKNKKQNSKTVKKAAPKAK